jgi:hypothetical protein
LGQHRDPVTAAVVVAVTRELQSPEGSVDAHQPCASLSATAKQFFHRQTDVTRDPAEEDRRNIAWAHHLPGASQEPPEGWPATRPAWRPGLRAPGQPGTYPTYRPMSGSRSTTMLRSAFRALLLAHPTRQDASASGPTR